MKLALGTVQFGLDYGISNPNGKVTSEEVRRILKTARSEGITLLDTAAAYGDSEGVLGEAVGNASFDIVTKTLPLDGADISDVDVSQVLAAFERSLSKLRRTSVYGLMVHHADDLLASGGERLFTAMQALKASGKIQKVGVSVYTGEQIEKVLERFPIELIQLPVNVLDQRLLEGHLSQLKQAGVEIHARSVFLQGLLLLEPRNFPAYFQSYQDTFQQYHAVLASHGISPLVAALNFVKGIPEIDRIICGVTSEKELSEIFEAYQIPVELDYARFAIKDEMLVNPAKWSSPRT